MPKLRTYYFLKRDTLFEIYLSSVQNISDRIALTQFRLSNHNLMIKKGRHQNMELHDRSCPFCPGNIENELHFLVKCPTYASLRESLFNQINDTTTGFYHPHDDNFLFWFLQNNPTIANLTARFIILAMELRALFLFHRPGFTGQACRFPLGERLVYFMVLTRLLYFPNVWQVSVKNFIMWNYQY